MRPPTEKEAFKGQLGAAIEQVEVKMDENGLDKYLQAADDLLERYSAQDLAALLLKTIAKDPSDLVPVKITPERPLPQGKKSFNKMVVAATTATTATVKTTAATAAAKLEEITAKTALAKITVAAMTKTRLRYPQQSRLVLRGRFQHLFDTKLSELFRSTCQCVPLTKRPLGVIDHCSDIFALLRKDGIVKENWRTSLSKIS